MASHTACMLVGSGHPNHGGISANCMLLLSENHRPAWELLPMPGTRLPGRGKPPQNRAVWIPTVEDMLEDGLLMVGLLVHRDPKLVELATSFFKQDYTRRIEMYDDIDAESRRQLYSACRMIGPEPKVVLTVLNGSTLRGQLPFLKQYRMDLEVCVTIFRREYSVWSEETVVEGDL
jgi:hypothetical protein